MEIGDIPVRGRGLNRNPAGRFEKFNHEPESEAFDPEAPAPRTEFLRDSSRSILTPNDSPDIPYNLGLNPYRGCEHGCAYCYARPYHEYLGFSSGLDFETRILVKEDAPELLREELSSPKWRPQVIGLSGVTDCYQPIERRLRITRRCLEVLAEFRNPVTLVTKNRLVARDSDLLGELAGHRAAAVYLSITTLDPNLVQVLEPRTSRPEARLDAIRTLSRAGVPVGVMVAPVIPGLTDHEMPTILKHAAEAGARFAAYIPLRLPLAVADLFEHWLTLHFPDRKEKVLNRVRAMRGGSLNDTAFHRRMRGDGLLAEQLNKVFKMARRKAGIGEARAELSTDSFRAPGPVQGRLFDWDI
ncbi:MAG: hypothetical protein GHCLOJNM_02826 [bacterium]|nr:hypothetical protein [bacterium]